MVVLTLAAGAVVQAGTALADLSSPQIIAALNTQREANGIPPVREDAQMAAGCAAYDGYVVRNGLSVADEHFEIPGKPGYTAAGDHAARTSVLADQIGVTPPLGGIFGFGGGPLFTIGWQYGDPWNHAAFHLFQLMNPALALSGGDERTARLRDGTWVRLECLNTFAGPWRTPPAKPRVYFYPGPGTTVSASEQNQEGEPVLGIPPHGYGPPPVFAYIFGRGVTTVRIRSLHGTLDGKPVPVLATYAGGASGPARAASADSVPQDPTGDFYGVLPGLAESFGHERKDDILRDAQARIGFAVVAGQAFSDPIRLIPQ